MIPQGSFLLGGQVPCYMDFYLFEQLMFLEWLTNDEVYNWFPHLQEYRCMVAELPNIGAYLESDDEATTVFPFNGKSAHVNNYVDPQQQFDDDNSISNPYG